MTAMLKSNDVRPPTKVALVTNIPAPYRIPIYENLASHADVNLSVFFCSGREPDREWDLRVASYVSVYLKEKFISYKGRYIHYTPDVWGALRKFKPDVVITTGFNPSFILAYVYAKMHGAKHIAMTDGTYFTEGRLSSFHRIMRRWVYAGSAAYIGASQGSGELYRSYGIKSDEIFQSHLCANNESYGDCAQQEKKFDFVFSGRFIGDKNPRFAIDVAKEVSRLIGRKTSLMMMGSGELDSSLRMYAEQVASQVEVVFPGFVKQAELPAHYAAAKVMLFPTQIDTWGVVANEAMAAGVPVLVTPMAGVAGDLVLDGENGYVLSLELARWTQAAATLLQDAELLQRFVKNGRDRVQVFSYANAADGIYNAVRHAVSQTQ